VTPLAVTPLAAALLAAALSTGACAVDRRLRITTDPAGAEVTVDGKFLGEAPLELHFTHYGERRVRVAKRGYGAVENVVSLEPPWYGLFPFDLFSEVLVPVWRTDYQDANFTLTPESEQPSLTEEERRKGDDAAIARGRALQSWAPGVPVPEMPASRPESRAASSAAKPNERP
jgi:hypothetical protein